MSSKQIGGGIVIFDTNTGGGGGTVTGAESGTGIVGGKVRLGINPLLQDAIILGANFNQDSFSNDGTFGTDEAFDILEPGHREIGVVGSAPGTFKSLRAIVGSGDGWLLRDDADSVGMSGADDYFSGDDAGTFVPKHNRKYMQRGGVCPVIGSSFNLRLQTVSQTLNWSFMNNIQDALVRVNIAFFLNNLLPTTSVTVFFSYTDEGGTVRTQQIFAFTTLTTVTIPPIVFYAQKATIATIQILLNIPGANYNIYATAEYLQVFN